MILRETAEILAQQYRRHETDEYRFDPWGKEADHPAAISRQEAAIQQWGRILIRLSRPYVDDTVILPNGHETYSSLFTNPQPIGVLALGSELTLHAFPLRNRPFDMGSPLYELLVLDEDPVPGDHLLSRTPLFAGIGGPSGLHRVWSPLLVDAPYRTVWPEVVADVLGSISDTATT